MSPRAYRVVCLAAFLLAIGCVAVGAYRAREDGSGTSDFDDFWRTARFDFLQHGTMTARWGVHNYAPFFMLFVAPFALLPIRVAAVAFNLASVCAFGLTVAMTERLLLGSPRGMRSWWAWLPIGLVLAFAVDCVALGQMALFTLALLVLAWVLFEQGRRAAAGLVLSLAASLKLFPLLLGLFFLLKREGRVLAGFLAGLIVFDGVLTSVAFGPHETARLHRDLLHRLVGEQSALALTVADSDKMSYSNQALPLVVRRLAMPTHTGIRRSDGSTRHVNVCSLTTRPVGPHWLRLAPAQWAVLALAGAMLLGGAGVCRRAAGGLSMERLRLEYAGFALMSMLLSPVLWTFNFALSYFPLALVGQHVQRARAETGRLSPAAGLLALWAVGTPALASEVARAAGVHLALGVLLMCGLWALATRVERKKKRGVA